MDGDIVYSTPKEEREKKDTNKKRNFNNDKKREKRPYEKKEEEKPVTQYDSDGFEIITEKVKTKKPKRRDFDGERKKFKKDDKDEKERPQTAVRKSSNVSDKMMQKPKPVIIEKVELETVRNFFIFKFSFY